MVHDLNTTNLHINENLHINGLFFLQNPKNPIFGLFLGIIPKMRLFSKNLEPVYYPYGTQTS